MLNQIDAIERITREVDALREDLLQRTRKSNATAADALRHVEALRRQINKSRGPARLRWDFRLKLLQALFEQNGHIGNSAKALKIHRSRFYNHRDSSPLFKACSFYVIAWCKWHKRLERRTTSWEKFWPEKLDDPEILLAAGLEEPLSEDLRAVGVLPAQEATTNYAGQ